MISAANNRQPDSKAPDCRIGLARSEPTLSTSDPRSAEHFHVPASLSQYPPIPAWKRSLDLILIFLTMPVWLSAMAVVSLWIRIVSPGPLLYRQERIGYWGRRFMILK